MAVPTDPLAVVVGQDEIQSINHPLDMVQLCPLCATKLTGSACTVGHPLTQVLVVTSEEQPLTQSTPPFKKLSAGQPPLTTLGEQIGHLG